MLNPYTELEELGDRKSDPHVAQKTKQAEKQKRTVAAVDARKVNHPNRNYIPQKDNKVQEFKSEAKDLVSEYMHV